MPTSQSDGVFNLRSDFGVWTSRYLAGIYLCRAARNLVARDDVARWAGGGWGLNFGGNFPPGAANLRSKLVFFPVRLVADKNVFPIFPISAIITTINSTLIIFENNNIIESKFALKSFEKAFVFFKRTKKIMTMLFESSIMAYHDTSVFTFFAIKNRFSLFSFFLFSLFMRAPL